MPLGFGSHPGGMFDNSPTFQRLSLKEKGGGVVSGYKQATPTGFGDLRAKQNLSRPVKDVGNDKGCEERATLGCRPEFPSTLRAVAHRPA